ncbi:MAG: GGDEF domain-containing protein [Thermodesulfobacteriota bacterium]
MDGEGFCQEYSELFQHYLGRVSSLAAVILDSEQTILDCNCGFQRLLGLSEKPLGRNLKEFLYPEGGQGDPFSTPIRDFSPTKESCDPQGYATAKLNFILGQSVIHTLTCFVFEVEGRFLLFGEKLMLSDSQIINKMSVLNNELAELTRQLHKKNQELERANQVITRLMNTDPLTGLSNRRHFQEMLSKSMSFAVRQNSPLSLVMADLDHFKAVNDRFGHDQGDKVLVAFAKLLKEHSRIEDLPSRFGGEEFITLLPATDLTAAAAFAERIRAATEGLVLTPGPLRITASFGVTRSLAQDTPDTLIKRVDSALYKAKESGRNRVFTG